MALGWLMLCAFTDGGVSLIPGLGTKTPPHAMPCGVVKTKSTNQQINKSLKKDIQFVILCYNSLWHDIFLEKEVAAHSSVLAWEIPWTKESGGLQFMEPQKLDMT